MQDTLGARRGLNNPILQATFAGCALKPAQPMRKYLEERQGVVTVLDHLSLPGAGGQELSTERKASETIEACGLSTKDDNKQQGHDKLVWILWSSNHLCVWPMWQECPVRLQPTAPL